MMKRSKGFTRIDLVVTLLCAAFLVVTSGAVGNRGRERAKQLMCASQLGKWGQAIFMHAEDNDGRLMFMVRRFYEGPFPHFMGQAEDYASAQQEASPGEWNVFEINPYIGAFSETYDPFGNPQDCGITRLVACPSNDSEFMVNWCRMNCEWEWDFTEPSYSYWVIGGMPNPVDTGNPGNGSDGEGGDHIWQDLTLNTLSPSRLVMSDILAIDGSYTGSSYRYNHGINGWAWFSDGVSDHTTYDPNPKATGRNQFFGDGAVKWRSISFEECENLPTSQCPGGFHEDRWNGPGSGWIQAWNTSWY